MSFYIGLSSGTSMDGIDAALVEATDTAISLLGYQEIPYSSSLKTDLNAIVAGAKALTAAEFGNLNARIGREFAVAAAALLRSTGFAPEQISAIGSHGQTISHGPTAAVPYTLQLGDPNWIAAATGIVTVADFRGMDVALGGQGAPLVPLFHHALFASPVTPLAIVNIGGIANVTMLDGASTEHVVAFDTGPGNTLLDQWIQYVQDVSLDMDGAWAATGRLDEPLLAAFLSDPYFHRQPPKSTGREDFHLDWILRALVRTGRQELRPEDVQRTLLELTCTTLVSAIREYLPHCEQMVLCGGGARNAELLRRVSALGSPMTVVTSDSFGVPSNTIEAMAFAWLAHRRIQCLPGNLPNVTGASRSALLGAIYSPA